MEAYLFAASAGALLPAFVLLHLMELQFQRTLPAQCNQVLDATLLLQADAIHPYLDCMGTVGRAMYLEFYVFDLVLFPIIYATFLVGSLLRLWPTTRYLVALPVIAAAFDIAENVGIFYLISVFPSSSPPVELAVSVFTRTKWLFAFLATAIVVVRCLQKAATAVFQHRGMQSKAKSS
ncbi:hypothetical protein P43SY_004953 [Pythium insidiosum]|uniref:EXPERA domain-containing protein n=1 Tax=Pythium insidiosum TaxID=114742 RepID=A0AAD5M8W5_PYTIN|nr:hypothetical protein P43SY_004953 [Pythium insidiosum]